MFVLRSLFWLSMVVVLLPPSEDGREPAPRVNLLHTAYAARELLEAGTGVCDRNPDACAASREALVLLSRKIETGADIFVAGVKAGQAKVDPSIDHGTLTDEDLQPGWAVADASR
jgi:hypothetical protein